MQIDCLADRTMNGKLRADALRPRLRLLTELLELAGPGAEVIRHRERPWASITFSGSRHRLALAFRSAEAIAAGEAFIATLPDHQFRLPGQLVANVAIIAVDQRTLPEPELTVEAELLLLEEC